MISHSTAISDCQEHNYIIYQNILVVTEAIPVASGSWFQLVLATYINCSLAQAQAQASSEQLSASELLRSSELMGNSKEI